MVKEAKNIIRKQTLDFNYNGIITDAFSFQKEIDNWCKRELAEALEYTISGVTTEQQYIRLDKLTIDINVNQQNWKAGLAEQIVKQIKEKLQNEIPVLNDNSFFELLIYYSKYGFLPWWSSINSKHEFEKALHKWLLSDIKNFIPGVLLLLRNNNARSRIAFEFSSESFIMLIAALTKSELEKVYLILHDILIISSSLTPVSTARNIEQKFKIILLENLIPTGKNVLKESIQECLQQEKVFLKAQSKEILNQLQSKEFINAVNEIKINAAVTEKKNRRKQ